MTNTISYYSLQILSVYLPFEVECLVAILLSLNNFSNVKGMRFENALNSFLCAIAIYYRELKSSGHFSYVKLKRDIFFATKFLVRFSLRRVSRILFGAFK